MNVLFMGTPDFAVGTLQAIIDEGHEIIGVMTQPDKPKGRGKAVLHTPVKELALQYKLPVYQPVKVKEQEVIQGIREMNPDVIVVVAFGQIIPKEIIEMPRYGCINVHASLLPKYRGAAPIQWAVINGEKESGVTTMRMDEGLDTGDMILKKTVPLDKKETGGSLFEKLSKEGASLLIRTLKELEEGTASYEPQSESTTSYASMLKKQMGHIDFNREAVVIERLIRGLNPWPSAFAYLHGKTLKIWAADVLEEEYSGKPGEVIGTEDGLYIKTGKGALKVTELQLEGKKRMKADAFLRGYQVEKGIILE
jgi:methionyl-tRNA formyltransferase